MAGDDIVEHNEPYEQLLRFIDSLSDRERETYKDLIADALRRDSLIADNCLQGRRNAERFAEIMTQMMETAHDLQSGISRLCEKLSETREASDNSPRLPLDNGPCLN